MLVESDKLKTIISKQKAFFGSGQTRKLSFRLQELGKLKSLITQHEADIAHALEKDLGKPLAEAALQEVILVQKELDFTIKNLKKWMKPARKSTPIFLWPARSEVIAEPYGCSLIIGPWNYPFMLMMTPLIGAISAGNCAIVKPSEVATHTQALIINLINKNFSAEYVHAISADAEETSALLQEKFDYIFFTGGTTIGKVIAEAAAKHLTPVTLELGGKSPCIIDKDADLDYAARRIIWAKMINAGQTCIAPDYIYIHAACKEIFIEKCKKVLLQFYGNHPQTSASYGRIINQKHTTRLAKLIAGSKIICGGGVIESECYISPTLLDNVTWQDPIMQEEIFGPVLPILSFTNLNEVIGEITARAKPLALYLFTKNKMTEQKVMQQISFGSGCVNDCILQVANYHLPFGGVGDSGLGAYHGKYSFDVFSHHKSVYKKLINLDLKIEYPPYTKRKLWWLRQLLGKL